MTLPVFLLLVQDGTTTGLIYGLLAISILLVFLVTRVLWVAAGDLVVFAALTLASISKGQLPGTVWMLSSLAAATLVVEIWSAARYGDWRGAWSRAMLIVGVPAVAVALTIILLPHKQPLALQALMTLLLIVPLGTFIYRLAFQPVRNASTLVLLFVAVAVHYALTGLGLIVFGPDGYRVPPLYPGRFDIGVTRVSWQFIVVIMATAVTVATLWFFFDRTMYGKALKATAVNRMGAQLCGLSIERSGAVAFTIATLICALSGILIGSVTTLYYDSGFAISLKGFVGVVLGAMTSFPLAVIGALGVGLVEIFASFTTSTYRDVIVFALLIPVLLWRSRTDKVHPLKEDEE